MRHLEEIMPEIKKAARNVAYKWPRVTTEEDMIQDLSLKLLEVPNSIEKLLGMEEGQRIGSLIKIGHQIASGQRDEYDAFSGQFLYSSGEIRALLKAGALVSTEKWAAFSEAAEDLKESFKKLSSRYATLITNAYVNGNFPERGSADMHALYRAVDRLATLINRKHNSSTYDYLNGGRKRTVVTNQSAIAIGEFNYDGSTEEESYIADSDADRYDPDDVRPGERV